MADEAVFDVLTDGVSSALVVIGIVALVEATDASGLVLLVGRFVDERSAASTGVAAGQIEAVGVAIAIVQIGRLALVDDCKLLHDIKMY